MQSLSIISQSFLICCNAACFLQNNCVDNDGLLWNKSSVRRFTILVLMGAKGKEPRTCLYIRGCLDAILTIDFLKMEPTAFMIHLRLPCTLQGGNRPAPVKYLKKLKKGQCWQSENRAALPMSREQIKDPSIRGPVKNRYELILYATDR